MRRLIAKDLSEPYSIYVYRYFLYQWGHLCFLAMDDLQPDDQQLVGVVVSKLEPHRDGPLRGYIAMLAVKEEYRGAGIATKLVSMAIDRMKERDAAEVCRFSSPRPSLCECVLVLTTPNRLPSRLKSQISPPPIYTSVWASSAANVSITTISTAIPHIGLFSISRKASGR